MFKRPACVRVTSILLTATLLAVTVSSCHPVSASQNQEPIEITSVLGPVGPINWGGPVVEITLKNVDVEPVVSLTATLELDTPFGPFDFVFNVTPSNPLQPNRSTTATRCLIGGGFSNNVSYPLTINATLQNGTNFVYTRLVQIVKPLVEPPTPQNQEPIEITSVLGPLGPVNPAGPAVEITLKNVDVEPVVSLTATLELSESFDFTFDDVSPSNPLQPNRSTSERVRLIGGGGFSSNGSYPLTINATLQNGTNFVYTKLVQIAQPPLMPTWGWAIIGIGILVIAFIVLRRHRAVKA